MNHENEQDYPQGQHQHSALMQPLADLSVLPSEPSVFIPRNSLMGQNCYDLNFFFSDEEPELVICSRSHEPSQALESVFMSSELSYQVKRS